MIRNLIIAILLAGSIAGFYWHQFNSYKTFSVDGLFSVNVPGTPKEGHPIHRSLIGHKKIKIWHSNVGEKQFFFGTYQLPKAIYQQGPEGRGFQGTKVQVLMAYKAQIVESENLTDERYDFAQKLLIESNHGNKPKLALVKLIWAKDKLFFFIAISPLEGDLDALDANFLQTHKVL